MNLYKCMYLYIYTYTYRILLVAMIVNRITLAKLNRKK